MSLDAEDRACPAPRPFLAGLWIAALLVFCLFQAGSWQQYLDGRVRGDAVQVFDMMLSRFAAGEGMVHTHSGNHFFKNHLMLWLYPAGGVYTIWDSLFAYLAILNAGLAVAVVPLGLLAQRVTGSIAQAATVVFVYTVSSATASIRLSVHPEALLPACWFLLFLGVETRRWAMAATGAVLACCVKEDQPLWLAVYFAWAGIFGRMPWRGAAGAAGASALLFVLFRWIMQAIPLTGTEKAIGDFWLERYGGVADSAGGLLLWFLTHPHVVLARVVLNPVWLWLVLASGVVSIFAWRTCLLLVPPALLFFSATDPVFHDLLYYYVYVFVPFLFLATVDGLRWMNGREWQCRLSPERYGRSIVGVLAAAAVANALIPTRVDGWRQWPPAMEPAERTRLETARRFVQSVIPPDAELEVATHYDLGAWVPRGRQMLFLREDHRARADAVLVDADRFTLDMPRDAYIALLRELYEGDRWRLVEQLDSFAYFERANE